MKRHDRNRQNRNGLVLAAAYLALMLALLSVCAGCSSSPTDPEPTLPVPAPSDVNPWIPER